MTLVMPVSGTPIVLWYELADGTRSKVGVFTDMGSAIAGLQSAADQLLRNYPHGMLSCELVDGVSVLFVVNTLIVNAPEAFSTLYIDAFPNRETHPGDIRINRKLNPRKPVG